MKEAEAGRELRLRTSAGGVFVSSLKGLRIFSQFIMGSYILPALILLQCLPQRQSPILSDISGHSGQCFVSQFSEGPSQRPQRPPKKVGGRGGG